MNKIWMMLVEALALLSPGIGSAHQIQVGVVPENVALSSEGPVLLLEGCEPMLLSNLYYEKGRCYTVCDIPLTCMCCSKCFETSPEVCDCCGCDQFMSDPFNIYPWLGDVLVVASPVVMMKPTGGGEFHADNQGGQASVRGGAKTNDGKLTIDVTGSGKMGPDGKVEGSVSVGGKLVY